MRSFSQELKEKAEVAWDLISQGAEEVHITGTDIKIVGKRQGQSSTGNTTQVVNVNAQATAQTVSELAVRLQLVRMDIEETLKNRDDLDIIGEKLAILEKELVKKTPDKSKLKETIDWALNAGWDIFLKIVPIIIAKLQSGVS